MGQCQLCKKTVDMPFTCTYCGQTFCADHRLPENHHCPILPKFKERYNNQKHKESVIITKKNTRETVTIPKISSSVSSNTSNKNIFSKIIPSKYQFRKIRSKIKMMIIYLLEFSSLIILSLPIYLTYLIDMQMSRDPLMGVLLQNMYTQNVLIPTGLYFISVLYLLYKKLSRHKVKFEWIVIVSASIISSWFIVRFITTISVISMIFQSKPPDIPDVFFFYREWILLLLSMLRGIYQLLIVQLIQIREYVLKEIS